jgi:hypothetical protein
MITSDSTVFPSNPSLGVRVGRLSRGLRSRRALIVLAAAAIALGVGFNWSWLVAAGIAPLLLSALPCVVMCALGLCVMRMGGRSNDAAVAVSTLKRPSASIHWTPVVLRTGADQSAARRSPAGVM